MTRGAASGWATWQDARPPRTADARDFLFLGRGTNYPIALEGALKLKEISYIHAEGYAAGEMKHGPIALIDDGMPVVVIAPRGTGLREDAVEHRRGAGPRRAASSPSATEGDDDDRRPVAERRARRAADAPALLQPLLTVVPLQLLALPRSRWRKGSDVDQPRNLAKSVTVE